eukprot:6177851-Pleurochrysis_carterae.AAC.2
MLTFGFAMLEGAVRCLTRCAHGARTLSGQKCAGRVRFHPASAFSRQYAQLTNRKVAQPTQSAVRSPLSPIQARQFRLSTAEYNKLRSASSTGPDFWLSIAQESTEWFTPPTVTLDKSRAPLYQWFPDG